MSNTDYTSKINSGLIDALHIIATPDDVLLHFDGEPDTNTILDTVWLRIKKIISIKEMGFLLVDEEGLDFALKYYQPENAFNNINTIANTAIEEGTFSWALNQNRAVVIHGDKDHLSRLFHVVAIRGKVIGMFVASFEHDTDSVNEITLGLLSIILLNCANTIEASALNMKVREQNEVLESRIEERTRELAVEKTRAEAASIAKSNFLATMSHEIRTPMNGVLGMAQVLITTALTEEQQLYVKTILDSGNSLLTVINDVLDFSKIEAGKMELEHNVFNLSVISNEVISLFNSKAHEKNIIINLDIDDNCPQDLIGDSLRIKQVLQNLLSNAIKFTDHGVIKISISGSMSGEGSASLMVSVKDSGIGIDKGSQDKLFSDFTQADSSTTRKFGGTGLGLAICKQLITLMGGEIGVNSQPDQGATFWFTINIDVSNESSNQSATNNTSELSKHPTLLQGNILLVEDNAVNQIVAKAILEKFGLTPDIANDGQQAIDKIKNKAYDLVLMDCQMPVLDGFDATEKIRQIEKDNNVPGPLPIVALTANAHNKDKERCLAVGMNDYLSKPIVKADLYNILTQFLKPQIMSSSQQIN